MRPFGIFFLALSVFSGCSSLQVEGYHGSVSDHFDGQVFHNPESGEKPSFLGMIRWQLSNAGSSWDKIAVQTNPQNLKDRPINEIRYVKAGHSTVLIQTPTLNILTDPIWSERCGPMDWAGPERVRPSAIRFEDLPPIDVVLVSHNHYDHMDIPTLQKLVATFNPLILVGLGNKNYLEKNGITRVVELDWWQQHSIKKIPFTFVPAQHSSGRGLTDRFKTLWGGFVFPTRWGPVYFAGDTAYGSFFGEIHKRFGPMYLSFLPIGGYEPRWYSRSNTSDPEDAILAHLQLHSRISESIHYETYNLTSESFKGPVRGLSQARVKYKVSQSTFLASEFGEVVSFGKGGILFVTR